MGQGQKCKQRANSGCKGEVLPCEPLPLPSGSADACPRCVARSFPPGFDAIRAHVNTFRRGAAHVSLPRSCRFAAGRKRLRQGVRRRRGDCACLLRKHLSGPPRSETSPSRSCFAGFLTRVSMPESRLSGRSLRYAISRGLVSILIVVGL